MILYFKNNLEKNEIYSIENENENEKIIIAGLFILGKGHFEILDPITNDVIAPATAYELTNGEDWFKKKYKIDLKHFILKNKIEIADTLTTILIGKINDRTIFFDNLSAIIEKSQKEKYIDSYIQKNKVMIDTFDLANDLINI